MLQISVQTPAMTHQIVTQVRLVHAGFVGAIVAGVEAMAVAVAGVISIVSRTMTGLVVGSFAKWQTNLTK